MFALGCTRRSLFIRIRPDVELSSCHMQGQCNACTQTEIDWNADELRVHMAGTEKCWKIPKTRAKAGKLNNRKIELLFFCVACPSDTGDCNLCITETNLLRFVRFEACTWNAPAFESFNKALSKRVQKCFDRSLHQKLNFMSGNRLTSSSTVWPLHVVCKFLSTPRWLPLGCTRNMLFFVAAGRHESCHCVCNSCYQISSTDQSSFYKIYEPLSLACGR